MNSGLEFASTLTIQPNQKGISNIYKVGELGRITQENMGVMQRMPTQLLVPVQLRLTSKYNFVRTRGQKPRTPKSWVRDRGNGLEYSQHH